MPISREWSRSVKRSYILALLMALCVAGGVYWVFNPPEIGRAHV